MPQAPPYGIAVGTLVQAWTKHPCCWEKTAFDPGAGTSPSGQPVPPHSANGVPVGWGVGWGENALGSGSGVGAGELLGAGVGVVAGVCEAIGVWLGAGVWVGPWHWQVRPASKSGTSTGFCPFGQTTSKQGPGELDGSGSSAISM